MSRCRTVTDVLGDDTFLSYPTGSIERMFDQWIPLPAELMPAELSSVCDAALVEAITGYARASAACDGRRLAVIAELEKRRSAQADEERQSWACDVDDSAAAEVAAAMNTGHGRAMNQLNLARLLRDRLPRINALLLAGEITLRLVATLKWRTLLVNEDVFDALDAALAQDAVQWGPLTEDKVAKKIDFLIQLHDPDAVRRLQDAARKRDITIGDWEDEIGTTSIWGRLLATDAKMLNKRLDAMATSVCTDDPRTLGQRRADALGALGAGFDHLACACGGAECPANPSDGRARNAVIHILADPSTLDAVPDPAMHGPQNPAPQPSAEPETQPAAPPAPAQSCRAVPGVILGGPIVPAALLAELIRNGAEVRFVATPSPDAEPRYAPSAKLAEFIRMRDMTCRFPGCDRAADLTDIDHTLPWPYGATHPSDLKCYCRKHHNLKTWWTGEDGWTDRQHPDGTVTVTSPSGTTYTTKPGSSQLFPGWNITTAASPPTGPPPTRASGAEVKVTKRQRTRAQDHAYRIKAERERNAALNTATRHRAADTAALLAKRRAAAHNQPHSWETDASTTDDDDPPPY